VIPAFNEAQLLPRLLDTVDRARSRYRRGPEAVEVIVADNGSTDATASIARDRGCNVVEVARRCIGAARNGGAAAAGGRMLAFVDADIRIHPATFNAIEDAMACQRFVAGATGVELERWSVGIAATYAMMVPWVWLLRMDTGVVFCSRRDFESVGGYDERLRAGEDVRLLIDLRRHGRRSGRRLTRLRGCKAIASMRKFDRHGDWHYFRMVPTLAVGLMLGRSWAHEYIEEYWYRARS
jgi:glycosyltransferase involved in cell wall biosynthesis